MKPLLLEREPTYCDTFMCSSWSGRALIGIMGFCLVVGLLGIPVLLLVPSLQKEPIAIIGVAGFLLMGLMLTRSLCVAHEQLAGLRRDMPVAHV